MSRENTSEQITSIWRERTKRCIEAALAIVDTDEVGPLLSLAMKCEDIEMGIADASDVEGYAFPGEDPDDESGCTCTPEQRASGGFKSTCPIHGV